MAGIIALRTCATCGTWLGDGDCQSCYNATVDAAQAEWEAAHPDDAARQEALAANTAMCAQCGKLFDASDGNDLCPDCQAWIDAHLHDGEEANQRAVDAKWEAFHSLQQGD